jgi:glycosyltransferase involved in cell wall biosynthesis
VALRVVGYIQLNDLLEPFRHRIQVMGMQDFVNLQRTIAEVEVNIVPLQNNVFTNCKSELKYFEAGAVGVPTIASPTASLAGVITNGVNGFLSRTHEWEGRLAEALDMLKGDRTMYENMADRAAEDSLSRFGWNRQARRIEAAVFGPT